MKQAITWYKTPIPAETLQSLRRRSDAKGLLQALGHLALLCASGTFAALMILYAAPPVAVVAILLHGTFWAFLLNAVHELCHNTVFASKRLNAFFLRLFSFLSWNSHVLFWASHRQHHAYTLHPPHDQEVLLPVRLTVRDFLLYSIVNPRGLVSAVVATFRLAFLSPLKYLRQGANSPNSKRKSQSSFQGEWMLHLFPEDKPKERRRAILWARYTLLGHGLIFGVSVLLGYWFIPLLVSAASFYGGWLLYFLNNTQHIGLKNNVEDYRLNARTILLGPVLRFLYWHMNYHIEHHMYASVPCYNLGRLHKAICHDTPTPPRGVIRAWAQILAILKRQKTDPSYQFDALEGV